MAEHDYPEHYCDNAAEAVELAEQLRASGEYDLFRGQCRSFPIAPTIFRQGVDRAKAFDRLNELASWIGRTPDLASLHGDKDAIIAVAQHHGMDTHFLDFTRSPKVAGFFATHGGIDGETGTIICLNRQRLIDSWADMNERHIASQGVPLVDVIEIDVRNLWRLRAQDALFLRCHVDSSMFEMFSFALHIYFPQTDDRAAETAFVYPKEKSHLEVLLDQYFLIETYPERERRLKEIYHTSFSISREAVSREIASYYRSAKLPDPHPSWMSEFAETWLIEPDEAFAGAGRKRVDLVLPADDEVAALQLSIKGQVLKAISVPPGTTRGHIEWSVFQNDRSRIYLREDGVITEPEDGVFGFYMEEMVSRMYEGMRYLPYTDEQIARAISRYVAMSRFGCYELIESCEGVEFEGGGIRGRGFCDSGRLLAALRKDFYDLVRPEKLDRFGKMDFNNTIFAASTVRSSYVFEMFIELFVEYLIPSQAAVAIEGLVIGLNPMRIDVLGES